MQSERGLAAAPVLLFDRIESEVASEWSTARGPLRFAPPVCFPLQPCMRLFKCLAVPGPVGPTAEMDSAGEERGWCQTDLWQASPASLGWVAARTITANKTVKKATTWKCGQKKLSACRNNFYLPSSWKTFE
ncbi:hypothetical protein MHYP_G00178570 [Metynnis hypsauchen]